MKFISLNKKRPESIGATRTRIRTNPSRVSVLKSHFNRFGVQYLENRRGLDRFTKYSVSKEYSFILRSLQKIHDNEIFYRWMFSFQIKGYFDFKMTSRDQSTLKLILEMVKPLIGCTLGILDLVLKNYYFDND